jgi:GNAT superfamily N-acetyltransferase
MEKGFTPFLPRLRSLSVRIRRARASDKEEILEFVKDIWRGHDYIPRVWDDWLRDRKGQMFVADLNGRPVGMNRIRFMPDGSGWLEGVRVHPNFRRMGIATQLGRNSMSFARKRGLRTIRLTSGYFNKPAHAQVAKMGLKEVARMSVYSKRKGARFNPTKNVRLAGPSDVPVLWGKIKESREYARGGGVYWEGFTAAAITPKTLALLVRRRSVFVSGEAVVIAAPGGEGSEAWRQICFATGPSGDVEKLVKYVFGRKERHRTTWSIAYAPVRSPLAKTLTKAGLSRWSTFLLFQSGPPKS